MHTSTRLQSSDFQFWQGRQGQRTSVHFDVFCPNYHELDRVGVVSPCLEDGVLHTAGALLALTTAFYDKQRVRATDFFDYPQHFAFVGTDTPGIYPENTTLSVASPKLWDAWSWLDVWPDNKWITAPPTASAMLKQIFDVQINRLFWPIDLKPVDTESPLPGYVAKMLKTSLKAVYYYQRTNWADDSSLCESIEIQLNAAATALVQESIDKLPSASVLTRRPLALTTERYQSVQVNHFLDEMQDCFAR